MSSKTTLFMALFTSDQGSINFTRFASVITRRGARLHLPSEPLAPGQTPIHSLTDIRLRIL